MVKIFQIALFSFILLIAIIFRTYKLASIPPGVNRDEASIGYTAYSILHTGKDEYGRFLPLSFESFGDWKLPLYIYETVISEKFLGLNELAVRLPSTIAGIIAVFLTFFLVLNIFKNKNLAFITMALASISPWSIHFSRVESESNTAVLFTIIALLAFFSGIKGKQKLLYISSLFFALCYFTYAGNYVSTTLLIMGLVFIYREQLFKKKSFYIAAVIFLALSAFISKITLSANTTKLSGISIFGDPAVVYARIEIPRNEHKNPNSLFVRLVNNRFVFAAERFLQNYLNAFSAQFLFISGGTNNAHNIKNFGNMYIVEAPFLFLGLVFLIAKMKTRERSFILWWLFTSPVAASITKDAPHTNRIFSIFPAHLIVTAYGIFWVISSLRKNLRSLAIAGLVLLFIYNIGLYIDRYFILFPRNESENWGIGYKKLQTVLSSSLYVYKNIIMEKPETSPYIYLLFYSKYDPALYQKQAVRYPITSDGFVNVKSYGRYEFRSINWSKDLLTPNTLIVDFANDVPEYVRHEYITKDILLPDSTPMFTLVTAK